MLGEISRIAASVLIETDLREEGWPDDSRCLEVLQVLDSIKELAGTPKDWEWDFRDFKLGFRHGSYYIRDLTKEEEAENEAMERLQNCWTKL